MSDLATFIGTILTKSLCPDTSTPSEPDTTPTPCTYSFDGLTCQFVPVPQYYALIGTPEFPVCTTQMEINSVIISVPFTSTPRSSTASGTTTSPGTFNFNLPTDPTLWQASYTSHPGNLQNDTVNTLVSIDFDITCINDVSTIIFNRINFV
jgi:hypothetical protein